MIPVPGIRKQPGRPSTLAVLIGQVKEAFGAIANPIPVMIGAQYERDFGVGSGPRVVFIPEKGAGKIAGDLTFLGSAAKCVHSCAVTVRAGASGDDVDRYVAAYALLDLVVDCIATGATGRITWGALTDDSPVDVDTGMGVGLRVTFTYERDIAHDASRWRLPAATSDASRYAILPDNRYGEGALPTEFATVTADTAADVTTTPTN